MVTRRRAIQTAVVGGAIAGLPRDLLAQDASPEASPAASPAVIEATPVNEVGADGHYPSGDPSVPDAWTKMPEPFKATEGKPLNGSEVKALVMTYSPPPVEKADNSYWQGLEERIGGTWTPTMVPNASYGEKAATTIASGDLPDLFYLNFTQNAAQIQQFVLDGAFLDLTEYVTGDALQEYPNLATFPDYMWESSTLDGKIWGIPTPEVRVGKVPAFRKDWSEKLIGKVPTTADEFREAVVGMSKDDPDGNGSADTWGISKYGSAWDVGIIHQMFNVPPLWRVTDDGTFQVQYELPEFKEALQFIADLYKDGAYHPDAASMSFEDARNLFRTGRSGLHNDGGAIYGKDGSLAAIREYAPDADVINLIPFNKDGGEGITYLGSGIFGYTAIPYSVSDPERVKELLRLLDWFSAPFGSEEWLYKNFGNEGEHFEYNDAGFPVGNDTLLQENAGLTGYMAGSLIVNYNPDEPELAPVRTDEQKKILEIGVTNPAATLFSPTFVDSSGRMFDDMFAGLNEIIVGRADISTLDDLVASWMQNGGEQSATEYEEAYKANQGS